MLPSGKRAKNARNISLPSLWQHHLIAMASLSLPWNVPRKFGKSGADPSSACRAHSYGEKIAKIGSVCPEIFD